MSALPAGVSLRPTPAGLATVGLRERLGGELVVPAVRGGASDDDRAALLAYLADYVVVEGAVLRPGETVAYGYWVLRLERAGPEQLPTCERAGARYDPPLADRLVMVTDGVFEGDPAEGVRYPSPAHMSGWWISTDRYDGDPDTLRREHAYHVTARRPDLARFLALPFGFRFTGADAWLDPEVAGRRVRG